MELNTAASQTLAPAVAPAASAGQGGARSDASRLPFIDAMRALVSQMVLWHHFALYGPLWDWAAPHSVWIVDWMRNYRWAVQIFFIISGYFIERTLSPLVWTLPRVGWFVVRRYCRLGLPYLGAITLALAAHEFARPWLPEALLGSPPTWPQLAAHVVFLQDILGYESLSTGLWFVAIEFQLGLVYVALLLARDTLGGAESRWGNLPLVGGWALALASLFYFNTNPDFDPWAVYFFSHFFMGVMIYRGLANPKFAAMFCCYALATAAALVYDWRWRLATSLAAGLVLFGAGRLGLLARWPSSRLVAYLGRTSYSLFLVHFPVLLVAATICVRADWSSQPAAIMALAGAFFASLAVADVFYRFIEHPTAQLSKKFK